LGKEGATRKERRQKRSGEKGGVPKVEKGSAVRGVRGRSIAREKKGQRTERKNRV